MSWAVKSFTEGAVFDDDSNPLPEMIRRKAWKRYDRKFDEKSFTESSALRDMFDWMRTEEGSDFWGQINDGNYDIFYIRYPHKTIDDYSII